MKNFLRHYNKLNFSKSYFLRVLILYSSFSLIIMMTSSLILIRYFNNSLEKEAYKYNKSLLTQVQIFSDTYLLGKVNALITENFLDLSKNRNISNFFLDYSLENNAVLMRASQNIEHYKVTNDFIDSIWIYRKADDILISSREGISHYISEPHSTIGEYVNVNLIKESLSATQNSYWVSPMENKEFWYNRPMISYIQCLPMFASADQRKGSVIINIDQDHFFQSINKILDDKTSELLIIDPQGRIFSHSDSSLIYEPLKYLDNIEEILNNNNGFEISTIFNKSVGISWTKSSINDWKYISIVPLETLNSRMLVARQFSLILMVFFVFLSLLGLNLITSRLYKPINTLVVATKNRFGIAQTENNEITYINNVLTNLSEKVEEMKDMMLKNEGLMEYKIVVDILLGKVKVINEINSRLDILDKKFLFNNYGILLIEINKKLFMELPANQQEYVTLKLIDVVNNELSKENVCLNISYPANCIASIINFKNYNLMNQSVNRLVEVLDNEIELQYNIVISKPYSDILNLHKVYSSINKFLKYSFIYGYQNIFTQEEIEKYEGNNVNIDLNTLNQLEALLKTCKIVTIKEEIKKIIEKAKCDAWSYNAIQTLLLQIIGIVCRVNREQNKTSKVLDKKELIDQLNNILYIDDCVDWIYTIIEIYGQNIRKRNNAIDLEFIEKIANHITEHIDEQISLNIVAEKFNISPSYLSKVFKEGKGVNFSEYVVDKKFEKAAELLLSHKKMKISAIAEKLGYLNMPYFSKMFKERYGITPSKYRKNHVENSHKLINKD